MLPAEANGEYHVTAIFHNADESWLQADADVIIDKPEVALDLTMVRITTSMVYYHD
jgi:hypothetical protein